MAQNEPFDLEELRLDELLLLTGLGDVSLVLGGETPSAAAVDESFMRSISRLRLRIVPFLGEIPMLLHLTPPPDAGCRLRRRIGPKQDKRYPFHLHIRLNDYM